MSYLNLSKGFPNFAKAVISFWFRVPQKSITAATQTYSDASKPPILNAIIPLVVMGREGVFNLFETVREPHWLPGAPEEGDPSYFSETTSPTDEKLPTDPTIIGVNCDPGYGRPVLYINFQTNQKANVSDFRFELRGISSGTFDYADVTDVVTDLTAAINGTNIYLDADGGSGADRWHHVLISLELPATIKSHGRGVDEPASAIDADYVDSAARLFVALDDIDYTEFDLSNYHVNHSTDHHAVLPELGINVAGAAQAKDLLDAPVGGIPQYTLSSARIPTNGVATGLPAAAKYVNNIYQVEMAEFQMWTGKTLDTGVRTNRRAFVDRDGKPVPPDQKQETDADGNVTKDSGSIELLGKRPEILLHGSSNWVKGYNTGTTGLTIDEATGEQTELPEGQFDPFAGIEPYKPDPSLEETTA